MSFSAFTLPLPVSTNDLWRPVWRTSKDGRRVPGMAKSSQYEAWIREAGYTLNVQRPMKIAGAYSLTIQVSRECRIDLGNVEKAVSDLLQRHGVIENDRLAEKITLSWIDAEKLDGAGMTVLIVPSKSHKAPNE
jgi:crossover junction endodeoxyribonuclease RusA